MLFFWNKQVVFAFPSFFYIDDMLFMVTIFYNPQKEVKLLKDFYCSMLINVKSIKLKIMIMIKSSILERSHFIQIGQTQSS